MYKVIYGRIIFNSKISEIIEIFINRELVDEVKISYTREYYVVVEKE